MKAPVVVGVFTDGISVLIGNWPLVLVLFAATCLGSSLLYLLPRFAFRSDRAQIEWRWAIALFLFFILSVILRLAFVSRTYVPPYFDSAEHYRIIDGLTSDWQSPTSTNRPSGLTPGYYHLGFHILASLLTLGLRADPIDVILVLGQISLAAIPIPMFFIVRLVTRSNFAGFLSAILAGFGWYMPAFAVNWGKYPALTSLLSFQVVLFVAILISISFHRTQNDKELKSKKWLMFLLFFGILASTFAHSRSLIAILLAVLSWTLAGWFLKIHPTLRKVAIGIFIVLPLLISLMSYFEPILDLALEPYFNAGIWKAGLVLVLFPFALHAHPRMALTAVLFILLVLGNLFIPLSLPSHGLQTLLDRPFVEMYLFLPLSFIAGLGWAGITHKYASLEIEKGIWPIVLPSILLFSILGIISLKNADFYPSDCCQIVRYDDTIALDWIDRYLPADARILIASMELNVLPSGLSESLAGTDAGIWIRPLTGRYTSFASYDLDFRLQENLERLCQMQVTHIYVGSTSQSFNEAQVQSDPDWFHGVILLPQTQLFELTGCNR